MSSPGWRRCRVRDGVGRSRSSWTPGPARQREKLAENVDLLVMEATYTSDLRELAVEHGHCTALDTARIAAAAGARRLAMTHFSTRYTTTDDHLREANGIHDDVIALEDLDRVPVDPAIC